MGTYFAVVIIFILFVPVIFFIGKYSRLLDKYRLAEAATLQAMKRVGQAEVELMQKKGELGRLEIRIGNYKEALETIRDYSGDDITLPISFFQRTENCCDCSEDYFCFKHAAEESILSTKATITNLYSDIVCYQEIAAKALEDD